jgi:hypothetical protein
MSLVLWLNTKVEVLSNVDVFLSDLRLPIFVIVLVLQNFDFEGTQNFTQSTRVIVEERFAHVIKILRSKVYEPVEFIFLDFLKNIFIIEGTVEF